MQSIGELDTGVKAPAIRYHEQMGSMAETGRSEGNQRRYDSRDREHLCFMKTYATSASGSNHDLCRSDH